MWIPTLLVASGMDPLPAQGSAAFDPAPWLERVRVAEDRARVLAEIAALPPAQRVLVWRRGIWLNDVEAAAQCAMRLGHRHVDHTEAVRVVSLLRPLLGDVEMAEPWFDEFRQLMGSGELTALLEDWPRNVPPWWSQMMLGQVHRQIRVEHVPALCKLAADDNAALGEDALRILGTAVLGVTDRHRDLIARAYVLRVVGEFTEPAATVGYPALLAACLEQCLVRGVEREGDWREWLCRWVRDSRPGPSDLPLLRRLAGRDEWFAEHAAIFGLGELQCEESFAALGELAVRLEEHGDGRWWFALSMLAQRGDAEALAALARAAREEGMALAFLWHIDAARARELWLELVCSGDDDLLDVALGALRRGDLARYGAIVDDAQLDGVKEVVAARVEDGFALARIVSAVPSCRDLELGRRAADHPTLRNPVYGVQRNNDPGGGIPGFLAFLEVTDTEALARLLRAWAASDDEDLRDHGCRLLLALGRAADAEVLLSWIAAGDVSDEDVRRLGAVGSPAVEEYLRRQTARAGSDEDRDNAHLSALAVFYGVPAEVQWIDSALDLLDRERVRELIRARRPLDVLGSLLESKLTDPDALYSIEGLGLVDDPRVRAYLRALQRRRELGLYAWATGQLMLMGEADAAAELRLVVEEGRYRWLDGASPRVRTFDRDLALLQHWTNELESNCCRVSTADSAWEELLGFELADGSEPPVIKGRRWSARWGDDLSWSRLANSFVPGPR